MSDGPTEDILKEHLPAEILDAAGQCLATGRARLVPETNFGTFLPDSTDPQLDAQLLGPKPVALRVNKGAVYKVNGWKVGEGRLVSKYFVFRHYGMVGVS